MDAGVESIDVGHWRLRIRVLYEGDTEQIEREGVWMKGELWNGYGIAG